MEISISTHSLTKRLTKVSSCLFGLYFYFNSQPHEEADDNQQACNILHRYFNSQPHEEADRRTQNVNQKSRYFNSQPHEEAD